MSAKLMSCCTNERPSMSAEVVLDPAALLRNRSAMVGSPSGIDHCCRKPLMQNALHERITGWIRSLQYSKLSHGSRCRPRTYPGLPMQAVRAPLAPSEAARPAVPLVQERALEREARQEQTGAADRPRTSGSNRKAAQGMRRSCSRPADSAHGYEIVRACSNGREKPSATAHKEIK
jgi:hypothetical protein